MTGSNGYRVDCHGVQDILRLAKVGGGTATDLDTDSVIFPAGTWLRVEVGWGSSGTITANCYDASGSEIASVTGSDSDYSSGASGGSGGVLPGLYIGIARVSSE